MLQNGGSVAFAPISNDFDASSSAIATHRKTGLLKSAEGYGRAESRAVITAASGGTGTCLIKKIKKIIKKKRREPLYLLLFA